MSKIKQMLIEKVALNKIDFDPTNPNKMTARQKDSLRYALKKIGNWSVVALNKKGARYKCIDGHHRIEQLLEEKESEVLALVGKNLTELDEKLIRQSLNKNHGKHIRKLDAAEFKFIHEKGDLDELARMSAQSLEFLKAELEKEFNIKIGMQEQDIPDAPLSTKIALGDVFQLGDHRVMCGDATNQEHIEKLIAGSNPAMLFTDPPFDFNQFNYLDYIFDKIPNVEVFVMNSDKNTVQLLLNYHAYFVNFFLINIITSFSSLPNQPMIKHDLITHYRKGKNKFQNLRDAFSTVHDFLKSKSGLTRHEKSVELPKKFILHYTELNEIVLDLFASSGSTLIACEQTQRVCYSMDIEPKFVDVILQRYRNFTKNEPIKIS